MTKVLELIRSRGSQVHGVQRNTSVAEAARALLEKEVSSFLVYDGDKVVGILTKNDLVRRCCVRQPEVCDQPVSAIMTTNLFTVSPDANLEDVFSEMIRRALHHVPVMDGDKVVGMLTPIDILVHQRNTISFENQQLMRYISGNY